MATAAIREVAKWDRKKFTENQTDFISREIMNCELCKILVKNGKSNQEIIQILDLKNLDETKFKFLTGKDIPKI